jgi:hypothetical protein
LHSKISLRGKIIRLIAEESFTLISHERAEAVRWALNNKDSLELKWTEDSKRHPNRPDLPFSDFALEEYLQSIKLETDNGKGEKE